MLQWPMLDQICIDSTLFIASVFFFFCNLVTIGLKLFLEEVKVIFLGCVLVLGFFLNYVNTWGFPMGIKLLLY